MASPQRPTPSRVTLSDVAASAGVSLSTVQRALRGDPRVADATAKRVEDAVQRTGLNPDELRPGRPRGSVDAAPGVAPRGAAKAGTGPLHLALLLSPRLRPEAMHFFPPVVSALTERVAAHGTLSLVQIPVTGAPLIPRLAAMGVDGVLAILSDDPTEAAALAGVEEHVPLVWVLGADVGARVGTHVASDNLGVGSLACGHLLKAGSDAVWFLTGAPERELFYRRWVGFQLRARRSGVAATPVLVGGDTGAEDAARELYGSRLVRCADAAEALRRAEAASAAPGLFTPTDGMLSGFFPAMRPRLRERGCRATLVSCDDLGQYLAGMEPRPASISLEVREVARVAVQEIAEKLADPDRPHRQVLVSPRLSLPPAP